MVHLSVTMFISAISPATVGSAPRTWAARPSAPASRRIPTSLRWRCRRLKKPLGKPRWIDISPVGGVEHVLYICWDKNIEHTYIYIYICFSHSVGNSNPNWRTPSFFGGVIGMSPTRFKVFEKNGRSLGNKATQKPNIWKYGRWSEKKKGGFGVALF